MKNVMSGVVLGCVFAMTVSVALAQSDSDKQFLTDAAQGNVAEVELGKLALKKSNNAEVKQFAKRMIHDHEMLQRKMKPFVKAAGVAPPTGLSSDQQETYNKLNGYSGEEFDKEYIKSQDKDHHEDLEKFKNEVSSTQDAALKTAVEGGEKVIQEHTDMVDSLNKKING